MSAGVNIKLNSNHLDDLRASGLKDETISQAGFYSTTSTETHKILNRNSKCNHNFGSCLVIPYIGLDGQFNGFKRIKPDDPRTQTDKESGKQRAIKYESPYGASNHAYFTRDVLKVLDETLEPICLTEGEKKALCLTQEGFPAVGIAGVWCWTKPRPKDPETGKKTGPYCLIGDLAAIKWTGRKVYIVFDSDITEKGEIQLAESRLAETLTGLGARIYCVRLPSGQNSEKLGVDDFIVKYGRVEFKKLMDQAQPFETWEPPIPLGEFILPKFPLEDIPVSFCVFRGFCAALAESIQVPIDMPALLALTVGGATMAKKAVVHVRGDHIEPLNLYAVIAMEPANRKSAVFNAVYRPLNVYEQELCKELEPTIEQNHIRKGSLEERLKELKKKIAKAKNPEVEQQYNQKAQETSEELRELHPLNFPRILADDITPERVATLLSENEGKLAIFSPEGDLFDLMAGRYSTKGSNLGIFLKGHAGDDVRVDRVSKDRPAEFIQKPALSIGLTVQPDVINGLTSQPGFRGRGLLGRFLYAIPRSLLGHRKKDPISIPPVIEQKYDHMIRKALELKPKLDENGQKIPYRITFSQEALKIIDDFTDYVEVNLADGGQFATIRDWAGKLVGAVCRISGIIHSLIHAESSQLDIEQISPEIATFSVRIGHYLTAHAQAAYFCMGADPSIEKARQLSNWILAHDEDMFSKRDIYLSFRSSFHTVNEMDAPLSLLESHGYIRSVRIEYSGPGRKPSPKFKINPLGRAHNTQNTQNSIHQPNSVYSVHSVRYSEDLNSEDPPPPVPGSTTDGVREEVW